VCGITGFLHADRQRPVDRAVLERMARTLSHRGPDAEGFFVENGAALGFQRLSIIDLAGGNQPLFNEDRSLVLLCNGEIFNYRELRACLETQGHHFATATDVEVILHLFEEKGNSFLADLNGQFAIALYDRKEGTLLLARDHLGINPLHWCVFDGTFLFGSEIKAILEHPAVPRQVDLTGLDQILSFPGLVSPRTMFKGIHSLRPGHFLLVRGAQVADHEYWDLDYPRIGEEPSARAEEEYVEELRELFFRSVAYRLQADVPVGYYLSGGLDSSMIAAAIGRVGEGLRRKSFSVVFAEGQVQDRKYQRLMADSLGTQHHEVPFDCAHTAAHLARVIRHGESPVKETYNTCTLALSAAARDAAIPVVLTGEGADELFAGYVGYRFDQLGRRARRPFDVRAALEEELCERTWGSKDLFYEHDLYALGEVKSALYSADLAQRFAEFDCLAFPLVDHAKLAGRHPIHCRSYLDVKLRLCDHLLGDHGDRMALANSVEARHPFLDIDLVEMSSRIPPELKINRLTEKYILRQAAAGLVPAAIAAREKSGWFAPGSPELLQNRVEWVCDLLSHERIARMGYFDPDMVESLKRKYAQPGFRLNLPFEGDLLAVVLTFNLFVDLFAMPSLS
jgi:asparagine synthase (glutamine-hydrolysing)